VGLNPITQKLLPQIDSLLLVIEPVPSTNIQTKALLQNLNELGFDPNRVHILLVSRTRLEITVPNNRVQSELNVELAGVIMPAPELAYQSALRHEAILTHQPDSIPSRQFIKLADVLLQSKEVKI
jgi:MinD-like ATPase involved in chromosome partitioning or flagellar assembly